MHILVTDVVLTSFVWLQHLEHTFENHPVHYKQYKNLFLFLGFFLLFEQKSTWLPDLKCNKKNKDDNIHKSEAL